MKRVLLVATLALAALLLPRAARAQTATSDLTVTATVLETCTIGAGSIGFGTYSGAQVDASGTFTVTCNQGATYFVGMDAGLNGASATLTTRAMDDDATGTSFLDYELYRDAGRTQLWDLTDGGLGNTTAPSSAAATLTVYGRIRAGQVAAAGGYGDTVTMTVNF